MINPFSLIWSTISSLLYYLLVIGLPLLFAVFFLWLIFYWYNSKKVVDDMKEEHMKMVHVAKSHKHPGLKELVIVPIQTENPEDMNHRVTMSLGAIIGHQEVDCIGINPEEAVQAKIISPEQAVELKKELESLKSEGLKTLHHFVYTTKGGWFGSTSSEHSIIAFSDQILNMGSYDGKVLLKGVGLKKIGEYEVLQGYPDRAQILLTHIAVNSNMETVLSLIGQTRSIVAKAIDLDSQHFKQLSIIGVSKQTEEPQK